MDRDRAKKILKVAIFLYIASFLIINWSDVSWIFNYREVSGLINDFFVPYPSISPSFADEYFYPNHSQDAGQIQAAKEIKTSYTDKQNALEIPKISVLAPIVFSTTTDKNLVKKDLDSGVVYYPGSVWPGQTGQIVVLGHSAPPGWPKIKYDQVFNDLDKLDSGDIIYLDLNNKQYTYIVKRKIIINKGDEPPIDNLDAGKNILTLITCWPPGKDYKRMVIQAELVDN